MASKTEAFRLDDDQVRWAVEHAARAPSVNNTQPWRFGWAGGSVTLRADLRRGLTISDPEGRELVISCGAALYNLRLALRQLGLASTVAMFPDASDPRALARVTVGPGAPPADAERELFAAIPRRHTHRGGFDDPTIRPDLAVRLMRAAESQAAQLLFVHDPGPQRQILHLARAAEHARHEDPEARAETEAWTPPPGTTRRDGVPARAYRAGATAGREELAARDFDLGRGQGRAEAAAQPVGGLAALVTGGDLVADWLRGGEALQAVLLTAALDWSFAVLHSRVTEVPGPRAELRRALGTAGYPQLLLRFGYAGNAPTTPRRAAVDVIDVTA